MLQTNEILGIIPARMASTRFPGKPLVPIKGIPMVIRVYQEASKVLKNLVIASGDEEIGAAALHYGADFILTRGDHISGTSRCMEAMNSWSVRTGRTFDAMINIQGDEPMVTALAISTLAEDISRPETGICTLIKRETDPAGFSNPNRVKVVTDKNGYALYFSRSPIPYFRSGGNEWFSHIGMYAFKKEILEVIGRLQPGVLELAESLEQLRWLENGHPIHCRETGYTGFGIDTPADLDEILRKGLI